MKKRIFITGATGCVGHYIFELLVKNPEYELYLYVRNPQKMLFNLKAYDNVHVVQGEMANVKKQAALLKQMDYLIHLATCWGTTEANYDYTLELFSLLDPHKCQKVIYFSTASILDSKNQLIPNLDKFGTSYIKGKSLCHKKLMENGGSYNDLNIITLFPTWVLGGDQKHPYSHAASGIKNISKWLWLLRFFTIDLSFHFIHAQDMALIVDYLLKNETKEKKFVLGNDLITADQFIGQVCQFYHQRRYFKLKIPLGLVSFLGRKSLSEWDQFCLKKKHFEHQVSNAATFGLKSKHSTIAEILSVL